MIENLFFGGVSFAAHFSSVPRALPYSAMVARRIQKNLRGFLAKFPNFQPSSV